MTAILLAAATVSVGSMELKTYPFSDPDPVPCTERKIYPYARYDGSTWTAETRTWKTVTLENEKIRVVMTPEIGGKVWGAVDKKTGVDFIYFNHVAKFRDIAQCGPWTSGGIEFNFGTVGHAPTCSTPVDYVVRTNNDASVSCFVGATEWICGTTWQVEVRLGADDDFFETRTIWTNGSNFPAQYYQWMNAAFHLEPEARFLFPGRREIFHDGVGGTWPADAEGRDLSVYSHNAFGGAKSYHVICGDNGFYGVWWPERKLGAYHRNSTDDKYGRKIWLWPLSRAGGIWEDLLTDSDGQYTELQSGRAFNQPQSTTYLTPFKHPTFAPGATDLFTERWGVLHAIPEEAKRTDFAEARPHEMPSGFDWDTAYGRYLKGVQMLRNCEYTNGVACLESCLRKEPNFAPALDELALLAAKRGHWEKTRAYARHALAIDTYDAAANYADGVAAFASGDLATAKERLGLAAYSPLYRVPAMALYAKCEMRRGDWEAARVAAQKALDANVHSPDAVLACLVAYRKLNSPGAVESLARIFEHEQPLCPGVAYERGRLKTDDVRTLIALGSWYEEAGLLREAAELFARAKTDLEAAIRRAYLEKSSLADAKRLPVAGVSPFRRESRPALEWAVRTDGDWRFRYLLAVLEAANGDEAKARELLAACGDKPDESVFYLYRAKLCAATREKDLKRAAKLGDSWRVGSALAAHFAEIGRHDLALKTAQEYLLRFPANNPLELAVASALQRLGRFEECIAFLKTVRLLPSEHGGNASGIWIDCHRALAEKALAAGDRAQAMKLVAEGLSYPENLGRGKPFSTDDDVKDWSDALKALRSL